MFQPVEIQWFKIEPVWYPIKHNFHNFHYHFLYQISKLATKSEFEENEWITNSVYFADFSIQRAMCFM